jgi:putative heme-binding domain-containing protein
MRTASFCFVVLSTGTLVAQHSYTPADIEEGGRLFRTNCSGCHGQNGDLVPGVALMNGQFRRASTDDQLVEIIRTGIAGTPMPAGNYTEFQAGTIVAYLRLAAAGSGGALASGDAARGQAVFEGKGGCTSCHAVLGKGSRTGPDLSDIGSLRTPAELQRSLIDPDADIAMNNRIVRVVTNAGTTVTGRLFNRDTFTVQLLDGNEKLRTFAQSDLRELEFVDDSPMPSYKDRLTADELAGVIAYLSSLEGL